jgi:hypothetical protein
VSAERVRYTTSCYGSRRWQATTWEASKVDGRFVDQSFVAHTHGHDTRAQAEAAARADLRPPMRDKSK